jgi:hypothetical protein
MRISLFFIASATIVVGVVTLVGVAVLNKFVLAQAVGDMRDDRCRAPAERMADEAMAMQAQAEYRNKEKASREQYYQVFYQSCVRGALVIK